MSRMDGVDDEYWYYKAKRKIREDQRNRKNKSITVITMLMLGAVLAAFLTYCA